MDHQEIPSEPLSNTTLIKRHSLTQLKLPKKSSGAEFSDKSSTPKTPTPTRTVDRLLRNCDAIGLFEELKRVNPFDETFRKAVENKDGSFLSSDTPLKGITQDDELNTPQYPNLLKEGTSSSEKVPENNPIKSGDTSKPKRRSLIKQKNENAKRIVRPILPKPVHSAKEKLKAFILKDLSPVIVEKSCPEIAKQNLNVKTCKSARITSNKQPESNREAAKRYRERVKLLQQQLEEDNLRLRRENSELIKENTALKLQLKQLLSNQTSIQKTPAVQIPKIIINNQSKELVYAVIAPGRPVSDKKELVLSSDAT